MSWSPPLPPSFESIEKEAFRRGRKRGIWIGVIATTAVWLVLGLIGIATEQDQAASSNPVYSPNPITSSDTSSSGISETDKAIADQTWEQQSATTQEQFCQAVDYFGLDRATEIFNTTASLPEDEARQIVAYMNETYC